MLEKNRARSREIPRVNMRKLFGWGILALVLLAFLWFVPQLQGEYFSENVKPSKVPALVNEYRRTWAQVIGGFALLLGLYFTWRSVQISQDQQVTERFTRAIDQLGASDDDANPRLEIRLGGIYSLERIARDSPQRDYSTVIEILMAYVRENAPRALGNSSTSRSASEQGADTKDRGDENSTQTITSPPADIQAILDVLKRLEVNKGEDALAYVKSGTAFHRPSACQPARSRPSRSLAPRSGLQRG
jgi:hypothetical protein